MSADKDKSVSLSESGMAVPEDTRVQVDGDTQSTKPVATSLSAESESTNSTTLKQVYGMLCWLLINGNAKVWHESPVLACQQAVDQCTHLEGAHVEQLRLKMEDIARRREQILEEHGRAENVPRETRVFGGGPLFLIVDYAMSGHLTQVPADEIQALLRIHGVGKCENGSGPVRNARSHARTSPCSPDNRRQSPEHAFIQRARQLTQAEVNQMRSEMAIRRKIALRDAKVLADWTAMKRRELELREMKIREFIRAQEDGTIDSLVKFEEYLKRIQHDL